MMAAEEMAGSPRRRPPARREFKFMSSKFLAVVVASPDRAQCCKNGTQDKRPTNVSANQALIQLASNNVLKIPAAVEESIPSVVDTSVTPRSVSALTVSRMWSVLRPNRSSFQTTTVSPRRT
jgi:hypothetical protein